MKLSKFVLSVSLLIVVIGLSGCKASADTEKSATKKETNISEKEENSDYFVPKDEKKD